MVSISLQLRPNPSEYTLMHYKLWGFPLWLGNKKCILLHTSSGDLTPFSSLGFCSASSSHLGLPGLPTPSRHSDNQAHLLFTVVCNCSPGSKPRGKGRTCLICYPPIKNHCPLLPKKKKNFFQPFPQEIITF